MGYTIDVLDWSNTDQYMQPSSENGSDGEPYQVEANQNAEMVRVLTRRKDREAREGLDDIKHEHTSISPSPMPRPSAVLSETVTKRLYAVGGALDSQYSSQAYIDDLQNENGYGESQPRSPLIQGQSSPTLSPKQEPEYLFASHESSEAENLREEIHALENLRKTEQGKYFTSLELANKERDKYRDEARKWRTLAENALNLLKQAQGELGTVINDLEDGV